MTDKWVKWPETSVSIPADDAEELIRARLTLAIERWDAAKVKAELAQVHLSEAARKAAFAQDEVKYWTRVLEKLSNE